MSGSRRDHFSHFVSRRWHIDDSSGLGRCYLVLSVILAILAIVIWVFYGAIKFLVTFAIFADLNTRFLQAISIKPIFSKIATKFVAKFQFAILVEYLLFFLYISDSSFNFFFAKIAKKICYQDVISHESLCASYMRSRSFLPCAYRLEVKYCWVLSVRYTISCYITNYKFLVHYTRFRDSVQSWT